MWRNLSARNWRASLGAWCLVAVSCGWFARIDDRDATTNPAERQVARSDAEILKLTAQQKEWIATHRTIRLGIAGEDWPPFEFNAREPAEGISYDYIQDLARRTNLELQPVRAKNWSEVLQMLRERKVDVGLSMHSTPDREKFLKFTDPYFSSPCVIVMRSNAQLVQSLADLTNEKVAIEKDYPISRELARQYPHLTRIEFLGTPEALAAVATGKADAYVGTLAVATYLINEQALGNLKIAAPANLYDQRLRFGIRADWPELAGIFNVALASMKQEEQDAIRHRWFAVKYEQVTDTAKVWSIVFRATAVATIIAILVVVWNLRLNREVARRRRVEEALRQSEAEFRASFENDAVATGQADPVSGRITRANKKFCELTGFSAEELTQKTIADLAHPDDRSVDRERYARLVAGIDRTLETEKRYVRKNGETVWVRSTASLIYDSAGRPFRTVAVIQDITVQRLSQAAIEQREERFRALVTATSQIVWTTNAEGVVAEDAPTWRDFTGQSLEQLLGWGWLDAVHPEDRERTAVHWSRCVELRSICETEYRVRRRDGEYRLMAVRAVPILEADSGIREWVGMNVDITEQRAIERRLLANENRLMAQNQHLTEMTKQNVEQKELRPFVKQILSVASHALNVDRASYWAFSPSREQLICVDLYHRQDDRHEEGCELCHKDFPNYFAIVNEQPFIAAADAQNDPQTSDFRTSYLEPLDIRSMLDAPVRHGGKVVGVVCFEAVGEIREWHVDETAFAVATGNLISLGIEVDIRQSAERALASAKEAAESATQAKSEFLANMSHEIRTPLNGVIGMLELLTGTPLESEQRNFVNIAKSSAKLLLSILNDILDFSKIEAGKLELDSAPFQFTSAVREVTDVLSARVETKGLELVCDLDPRLETDFIGDAVRIQQIIINLVGNALKFTDRGMIVIGAKIVESDGTLARVQCFVRDTGIGIPAHRIDRMFQSFSQADASTSRKYGGTGLGLAICRELCALMSGSIRVESIAGCGSTFIFEIQLQQAPASKSSEECSAEALGGLRVLAVDDVDINLKLIESILVPMGVELQIASTPASALTIIQESVARGSPIQLLLLDFIMPSMTGLELAEEIHSRKIPGDPRTIIISSISRPFSIQELESKGVCGWLTKPIWKSRLVPAIQRAISENCFAAEPRVAASPSAELPSVPGARILVVEDNETNQFVVQSLLEKLGYKVEVRPDGKSGVEAAVTIPFDLILMDCQMPIMDGYEAAAEIRAVEKSGKLPVNSSRSSHTRLPILALTASAIKADLDRCLEIGMDGYLTKPLNLAKMCAEVVRLLHACAIDPQRATPVATSDGTETTVSSEPPVSNDSTPCIDRKMLRELCMEDESLAKKLLMSLHKNLPRMFTSLETAIEQDCRHDVAALAHQLRGAASNVAACRISQIATTLEIQAKEKDSNQFTQLLCTLKQERQVFEKEVEAMLQPAV